MELEYADSDCFDSPVTVTTLVTSMMVTDAMMMQEEKVKRFIPNRQDLMKKY